MGRRGSTFRRRAARTLAAGAALLLSAPLALTTPAAAVPAPAATQAQAAAAPVSVLIFHGAAAQQQDPVIRAADALTSLAAANGISATTSSDPAVFTAANLDKYRGVVFLSAQGTPLTGAQETALQNYIKDGNGFLGISDAAKAQEESTWFTGLIGTRPLGARPEPEPVSQVTVSAENPPNEIGAKLIDNNSLTKWLTFNPTGWVVYKLTTPAAISSYSLTSANDFAGRDPKNWTLQGSNDGTNWTDIDSRTNETFPERFQPRKFVFANSTVYSQYRLNITANAGDPIIQLADLALYRAGVNTPPPPEPAVQQAVIDVLDRQHPANAGFGLNWTRTDRYLNWDPNPVGTVHTIAQVEEKTYNPGTGANGPFHPISWCRDYDGGRSFYTGMGRTDASYGETEFRSHLLGALKWTTGMVRGDCKATIAANYKVERLTTTNAAGQLNQIGESHGLTVAANNGRVFYIGRGACAGNTVPQPNDWTNPNIGLGCGTIHQWDPTTKQVKLLTTLPVMGNRGGGPELVKNEEGLLGITLDPNFATNGWMYVFWMPHDSINRDTRIGKRTISRFTYNASASTIDLASRKDLMSWDTQIHSCCHAGGGMAFDKDGNLYVGSGDNNSSEGSNGYSGNNWTQDYQGVSFQDARRTAGNTNNLNGKIIRIHPEADGTYAIPAGNLFPVGQYPADKTRPEIYVMGVRNISRLAIDPETNWLTAAWVGPDATSPSPELGPAKYETATIITKAGNHGWPYCMGNKQPYRDRSSTDAAVLTGWYDCDNPVNTSPRNTGLVNLPPVQKNMIWYAPDGGGPVFPNRPNSGIPTYNSADQTFTEPYLRGGCQAVMDGPTYHYDRVNTSSGVAWPKYWDDKWFIGDNCNPQNRIAVTVDRAKVPAAEPPAFAESLRSIIPGGAGSDRLQSWMDAKFGPDGALYMLDYGSGFFTVDNNQKLIKISYTGGAATPVPAASNVAVQNKPLTYSFNGSKSGGVSWKWEFGDGTVSTQANPRHTYTRTGPFTAKLTTTYADGETVVSRTAVNVGCAVSDPNTTVTFGDVDTTVQNKNAGGGCKVDDLIDDESTWPSHAGFTFHVETVADGLVELGILTTNQRDTLVAAAESSNIGKPGVYGYDALYDGTVESFRNWAMAPSGQFVIQPDGSLRTSGGLGMLWYAKQSFKNFSLKMQFRDVSPEGTFGNGGVFTRFPDPRIPLAQRPPGSCGTVGSAQTSQAWVAIYCGHEIQIYDGNTGEPQKTGSVYNFDPLPLDQAGAKPKGTWSDYEIKVVGQHYTIIRNGVVLNEFDNVPGISSSRPGDPPTDMRQFAEGFIGLQNHGTNDLVEYRNVRVRPL